MKSSFHCDIVEWIELNNRVMDLVLACATWFFFIVYMHIIVRALDKNILYQPFPLKYPIVGSICLQRADLLL